MRRYTPSELPHGLGFMFLMVHIIPQDKKKRINASKVVQWVKCWTYKTETRDWIPSTYIKARCLGIYENEP